MIKIRRSPCPELLRTAPETGDLYAAAEVKEALWCMQGGKCCYCERHIPKSGQGAHAEHFRPKALPKFRSLRNSWKNLLLACSDCNGNKGHQFPERSGRPLLLDPSAPRMNPKDHITFNTGEYEFEIPGFIEVRRNSRRGRATIETLRLWESGYQRARCMYYKTRLQPALVKLMKSMADGEENAIDAAKAEFEELLADGAEFAGIARAFALAKRFKALGVSIP